MSNTAKVTVVIIPDDGVWVVYAPALGIASEGDSQEHALAMIKDAIQGVLDAGNEETMELLTVSHSADASMHEVSVDVPAADKVRVTG